MVASIAVSEDIRFCLGSCQLFADLILIYGKNAREAKMELAIVFMFTFTWYVPSVNFFHALKKLFAMIYLAAVLSLMTVGPVISQSSVSSSRRCLAPDRTYGFCVHAARCPLPNFKNDKLLFLDYFCVIDRLYIGICCPDKFLFASQAGTTLVGNPGALGHQNQHESEQQSIELKPAVLVTEAPPRPNVQPTADPLPQRKGCGLNEKMEVGRVTGGRPADPKEWPWMAAVMRGHDIQFCGGCLITEKHVLTAAHCVFQHKASQIYVRLGEHDFSQTDETRVQNINVSEIRKHGEFDEVTYENDIAILKLSRAALFNSYVWPACLPELGNLFNGRLAFVIGWGTIEFGGPVSDKLMEVSVPVWENRKCADFYVQPISDTNLCAGGHNGQDSCQGDSGGPLMMQLENRRWVAIGVVSWGIRCGEERPAVYTRVNRFLDWIVRNTL